MTRAISVALGEKSYDVVVGRGLIDEIGERLRPFGARRVAIVTDEAVAALHLQRTRDSLERAGFDAADVVVPPGERTKSFAMLERALDALLDAKIERGDLVVGLGGGVVGDLSGLAAGLLRRGVRHAQIPTTLLAQVDSSVGGKTGINARQGKNLIGLFHQPVLVIVDPSLLSTLPPRELRAGYAEVAKYGLLGDAAFFAFLETHLDDVLAGGPALDEAIIRSVAMKAQIVAEDETELGRRALLNLGHTFGHALEAATGYGPRLLHGEGVAIGMRLAFAFSARLGHADPEDERRVARHLQAAGLPARMDGMGLNADALMRAIAQDKKVKAGALTFILVEGIGHAFAAHGVPENEARAFLEKELNE